MQPVVNIDQGGGHVAVAVKGWGTNSRQVDPALFEAGLPVTEAPSQSKSANSEGTNTQRGKAIEGLKNYSGLSSFYVSFEIDDRTESVVVKVVDRETQEVLCQIPPEAILNMKARMMELQGVFFDHQA